MKRRGKANLLGYEYIVWATNTLKYNQSPSPGSHFSFFISNNINEKEIDIRMRI